jgi:UDP-N-acetylglucosamine 4,6-dehydratase
MFGNQTILITGGTGSWGHELTSKLLECRPKEVRIFSRNEFSQVKMQRTFHNHPSLKFIIGDVRDYEALEEACRGVDYIFHLAALKHVPICESHPEEALKTNVSGTENVIKASIRNNVKKVIDVSTDKAVDPINLYGMTKAIGEKLMIRANDFGTGTRFVCIRGGNVLGTNGSVVPIFKKQIMEGNSLTITSKEMTRFFLTISEAIGLLLRAAHAAIGGETFVMKMKACRIVDLANVLKQYYRVTNIELKEIGIRPGEKMHEVLVSQYESPHTFHYSGQYFVILPSHPAPSLVKHYGGLRKASFARYASDNTLMNPAEIEELLKEGGFLD